MSIISDPYKTFKDQALRIWDTKDYANRLAFNNTSWFLAVLWCFMFVTIFHLFLIIAVGDLFILAKFYSDAWYIDLTEEVFFSTNFIQIGLIFFWICPKVVRLELLIWKGYNDKERRSFEWLEGRIKQRFPNFKTSKQRERERLEKPRKEPKLEKWLKSRPPVERRLIRAAIWICWGISMATFIIFLFNLDDLVFDNQIEETVVEKVEVVEEELPPTKPDRNPPPTIYDIFIRQSDTVLP